MRRGVGSMRLPNVLVGGLTIENLTPNPTGGVAHFTYYVGWFNQFLLNQSVTGLTYTQSIQSIPDTHSFSPGILTSFAAL